MTKRIPISFERHIEIGGYFKALRRDLFALYDEFCESHGPRSKVAKNIGKMIENLTAVRSSAEDILAQTWRDQWHTGIYYGDSNEDGPDEN